MAKNGTTLFSYKDKDGVDVVVDRIEDVPQHYRSTMKVMSLDGIENQVQPKVVEAAALAKQQIPAIDMVSAGAGATGGMLVGVVLGLVLGKLGGRGKLLGTMMSLLMMAGVMTLYFMYARQQMGIPGASPAAIVGDTKAAKQLIQNTHDQKMKALEAIEKSEK